MAAVKCFVYVLVSESNAGRHYIGVTSNAQTRLDVHNSGGSRHTSRDRPSPRWTSNAISNQALAARLLSGISSDTAYPVEQASHEPEPIVHAATLLPRHDT